MTNHASATYQRFENKKTPANVATPFPPLNLDHTGKSLPSSKESALTKYMT